MARFEHELPGSEALSLTLDVVARVDSESGGVQHEAASFNTQVGLYCVDVTFAIGGRPYFEHRVFLLRCVIEEWPGYLALFMHDPEFKKDSMDLGLESPDLHMIVRRSYQGNTDLEGPYSFLAVVDTGAMPGAMCVSFSGPAIFFEQIRHQRLLDFARALSEEAQEAPIVPWEELN